MQFIFFSSSRKNRFFQQSVHELWSQRADTSMLKISQIIVVDFILFPMLRNVVLFFFIYITNCREEIMKNSSLFKGALYFFLPFSIPDPALISASEQYLMVPCRLIFSSASSPPPKGNILKFSKKSRTCKALDLAKGALKMTPDQQFSSKYALKIVEIVPSVERALVQQSSPGRCLKTHCRN